MAKDITVTLLFLLIAGAVFAQTAREVNGAVQDSSGKGMLGARIKLYPQNGPGDTLQTITNTDGTFILKNVKTSQFNILVTSLGFTTQLKSFQYADGATPLVLAKFKLIPGASMLDEIVIDGRPPVVIKEDTTEYRVSAAKLREGDGLEDLIKKLDGVEMSTAGAVTANGKAVTKLRVNGKDYFGGNIKTAMDNLRPEDLEKVQVIQDYGEQAAFTGIKEGEPQTILNLVTLPGRNKGMSANASAGGGSGNGQERYNFSSFFSRFKDDRRLGIDMGLNKGSSGGDAGEAGGISSGSSGGGGLSKSSRGSLTYTDKLGKKIDLNMSASVSGNNGGNVTGSYSEQANKLGTTFTNTSSSSQNNSASYGLNINQLTYSINKNDRLQLSNTSISYSNSNNSSERSNLSTGVINQDQITVSGNQSKTPSFNASLLYTHVYKKRGRNLSLSLSGNSSSPEQEQISDNNLRYYNASDGSLLKDSINYRINATENKRYTTTANFVFSEPLKSTTVTIPAAASATPGARPVTATNTTRLQFSYNISYANNDNSRIVSFRDLSGNMARIDALSNIFSYASLKQRISLSFTRSKARKSTLTAGVTAYPTLLTGRSETLNTSISRSQFYLIPQFSYSYTFVGNRRFSLRYSGSAQEPGFDQLQPIRNETNPQNVIVGNPDLDNVFNHSMTADYSSSKPKAASFQASVTGGIIRDQIVQNRVLVPDVYGSMKRETYWTNTNGSYNYNGNYSYSRWLLQQKFQVRLNGRAGFNNRVSYTDNIKNFSRQWNISQSLGMSITPVTWADITPNLGYTYTATDYTLVSSRDITTENYSVNIDSKLYFLKKALIFTFRGAKSYYSGYSGSNNTKPLVINGSAELRFLKKKTATLRLTANDIFNQANTITRSISETGFTDNTSRRTSSYYMLSLSMRLNRFGTGSASGGSGSDALRNMLPLR